MVNSADWIVGQIVQTLEETEDPRNPGHKLIDNTYVIVSSDNGGAQSLRNWRSLDGQLRFEKVTDNAPVREGKARAYEGGCRIPFIVTGPGIKPGSVNNETPLNLIDLFPTFMAMAGLEHDGTFDIDGCNILPVMKGEDKTARFYDGTERDTLYFHYPVLNLAFSTIRRGQWKLMKNTGIHVNEDPEIQLFMLYNRDGCEADIGEKRNVAAEYPEVTRQLLADLDRWLEKYHAGVPYINGAYKKGDLPGQKNMPAVTGRGSDGDRLWATFETGVGKARVIEAFLLYTVNGGKVLCSHGSHEEWFRAPARLSDGRVEGTAPPGMTHAVFCLIDENDFLIHSEPVPLISEHGIDNAVSVVLEDGYAYKPGLYSLIKCAESAARNAAGTGRDASALKTAVQAAKATYAKPVEEKLYSVAIRELRTEIRLLEDVPEAGLECLNFFPIGRTGFP